MRAASSGTTDEQLARKIKGKEKSVDTAAQPTAAPLSGSLGVVAAVNSDGTADVTYNGTAIPCNVVGDFAPTVGQSVWVLIEGERNWAFGPVNGDTTPTPWQPVAYGSGWSDFGSPGAPTGYRLIGDMVQLRGASVGGASGTTIFTLPVGYRPQYQQSLATGGSDDLYAKVSVQTNGVVSVTVGAGSAGSTPSIDFDGISFSISP